MSGLTEVFDYVIVGAGSAGCVIAEALSRDPSRSVCVLEAGGRDKSVAIRTPMLLQQAMTNRSINWDYETTPQTALNDRRLYWPRGKVLGGSSSINAMHYIRGAPENYDEWARDYGAAGWSWEDVLPVFKRVQNQTRGESPMHGVGGPLWVQDIAPLNPLTEAFLHAGQELQLPLNEDFNDGDAQDGVGVYQVTQAGGKRCSAADAFLRPALDRDNLTVITNALAYRVAIENTAAQGVIYERDGDTRFAAARRETILCGGAINSPQLLQLSGVGDPDHLRDAGVSVEVELAGVGRNLQDHLDIAARIETKSARSIGYSWRSLLRNLRDVTRWALRGDGDFTVNPVQGGGFFRSSQAGALPDIQFAYLPAPSSPHGRTIEFGHGATLHANLLYPKSRGTIRIRSADPRLPPAIDPCYGMVDSDLDALIDGSDIARRILNAPAFADDFKREIWPGPEVQTREELLADIRARAETVYHPAGTCAMGVGELAVTDERLRVRGVSGLRVADASIMPRLIGGNTNAPTIMIAGRASDMILADNS